MKNKFILWILKIIIRQKYPLANISGSYRVERRKDGYHIIF